MNAPLHSEHTWFEGFAWTPLACGDNHLGWKFVRTLARHDTFYLIVLSQIRYVDTKKWKEQGDSSGQTSVLDKCIEASLSSSICKCDWITLKVFAKQPKIRTDITVQIACHLT